MSDDQITNLKLDNLSCEIGEIKKMLAEHAESNDNDFKTINNRINTRVKFTTFAWVLGVLMTIVIGLFAVIYNRLESVNEKTEQTKNDVSYIKGTLIKAEITSD